MARLGALLFRSDCYDPLPHEDEILEYRYDIYQRVWGQASEFRSSGKLLELGSKIKCPVVVIHGDYDPHPAQGVRESLSWLLPDFRFIFLEKCGHYPWLERYAREKFFSILKSEIE